MTKALADAALDYLSRGQHILALSGKRPHPTYHPKWSWDESIHGEPDNENEIATVRGIFEDDPSVTGVALLVPEHNLVADVDSEEAAALLMLLAGGEMPVTATAMSHHGMHMWFLAPGAKGSRWLDGETLLFKGFGGYVVAPPSAFAPCDENPCPKWHASATTYEWVTDPFVFDYLPDGVIERFKLTDATSPVERPKTREKDSFSVAHVSLGEVGHLQMWQVRNIDGLVALVRHSPQGNRNNLLAWAALTSAEEGVSLEAMQPLIEAAITAGLPKAEAEYTVRHAFRRRNRA